MGRIPPYPPPRDMTEWRWQLQQYAKEARVLRRMTAAVMFAGCVLVVLLVLISLARPPSVTSWPSSSRPRSRPATVKYSEPGAKVGGRSRVTRFPALTSWISNRADGPLQAEAEEELR